MSVENGNFRRRSSYNTVLYEERMQNSHSDFHKCPVMHFECCKDLLGILTPWKGSFEFSQKVQTRVFHKDYRLKVVVLQLTQMHTHQFSQSRGRSLHSPVALDMETVCGSALEPDSRAWCEGTRHSADFSGSQQACAEKIVKIKTVI